MWNLALLLVLTSPALAQEGSPEPVPAASAAADAEEAWQSFLEAARGGKDTAPITAFRLSADVLIRDGVQTNELKIDYRYLEPACIRFRLPDQKEVGRFGAKQREYWLRDREEVVVLAGRDYVQDRKQIDEMYSVAKNFVTLSDPSRATVSSLELLETLPSSLSASALKESKKEKLRWLRVQSPDFALLRTDGTPAAEGTTYAVDLALQPDGHARFVIIREKAAPGTPVAEPMFIDMENFKDQNGFRIPFKFLVHRLDGRARPLVFAEKPAQEIYVAGADLRAKLKVEDFKP